MLIPKHHGFKRQYVIGGAGIFDSIANFVGRLFASSTAKQGVQRLMEGALDLSKSAAKEGAQRLASAAGKKLIAKALNPGLPGA